MPSPCDQTEELLPWLANGTLGPRERDAALAHLRTCPACGRAARATASAWEVFGQHPGVLSLLDHVTEAPGGAPGDAPGRRDLAGHLEGCPSCREEADLLRESRAAMEGKITRIAAPPARVQRWGMAAAAGFLLAVIGQTGWLISWRNSGVLESAQTDLARRIDALEADNARLASARDRAEAAQMNTPIIELLPAAARTRGTGAARPVEIPAAISTVTLVLVAGEGASCDRCDVELIDAGGGALWSGTGLVRQPSSDYTFTLPAGILPEGEAVIRLLLPGREPRAEVERYRLNVHHAPGR